MNLSLCLTAKCGKCGKTLEADIVQVKKDTTRAGIACKNCNSSMDLLFEIKERKSIIKVIG